MFYICLLTGSVEREKNNSQGHKLVNGVAEGMDSDKDMKKDGSGTGTPVDPAVADAIRHVGSAFSLVRPKTEPGNYDSSEYVYWHQLCFQSLKFSNYTCDTTRSSMAEKKQQVRSS